LESILSLAKRICFGEADQDAELPLGHSADIVQAAGIPRLQAPTIGISVDYRRQNLSEESLALNVERLKAYKARLILFPRKSNKPKKGDSGKEDLKHENTSRSIKLGLPFERLATGYSEVSKNDMPEPVEGGAYAKLRKHRSDARLKGVREKRAKDKADAEAAKK
jgi:large subunit ribosomal protein L13e